MGTNVIPEQEGPAPSRGAAIRWLAAHRVEVMFALALLILVPLRGYWAPDEPDFAQCVKEMRLRGSWLLPYLNGQPYTEKPILFYWLMKVSALVLEPLTGGAGFDRGIAAWALRLPSAGAAILFLFAFRRWAERNLGREGALAASLALATAPLWVWQAQFVQIDLLFSALLAWSWMCGFDGYRLLGMDGARARFLQAYFWLGLAVLAKGPLALVLSAALVLTFLLWERDLASLGRMSPLAGLGILALVVLPWYLAAGLRGGASYAYALIVHQNLERALSAWDHIQPWWRYAGYLAADFFPWCLLLPLALAGLKRQGAFRQPLGRFLLLAFLVPLVLLSLSRSKQGKYLLMAYPFLALLLGQWRTRLADPARAARILGGALGVVALALLAIAAGKAGGHRLQAQVAPFQGPLLLGGGLLAAGSAILLTRGRPRPFHSAAATLAACYLAVGAWGFRTLDARKDYREWARSTEPLMAGQEARFWGEIRAGAMLYSDRLLPEVPDRNALLALPPGQLVVSPTRRWVAGCQGLRREDLALFQVLHRQDQGSDGMLLLRRCPSGISHPGES